MTESNDAQESAVKPGIELQPQWGSDAIVDFLRATEVPYIALTPGASFRGLHDSLVNYSPESGPSIVMCLHEEHSVALAHGYAKVTGVPMAVALHANVGLQHAVMAIFNAYTDRAPVLLIGATGPLDAAQRRPWIDWIHTTADQASMIRSFIKWDDTPVSIEATLESLARAWDITRTEPQGPTYVALDSVVQESRLSSRPRLPRITTGRAPDQAAASADSIRRAADLLRNARNVVVMVGPGTRSDADYQYRIVLAEALGARVITDLKAGSPFPTRHPAHVAGSGLRVGPAGRKALAEADVVLALNWTDIAGALKGAGTRADLKIVSATLDPMIANGVTRDHHIRAEVDVWLPTTPDHAVAQLLDALDLQGREPEWTPDADAESVSLPGSGEITPALLAAVVREQLREERTTLIRLPLKWDGDYWPFSSPMDFLGYDGGGGIGSGPGMTVGAALALRGTDRLPVSILGDGDFMMGVQALWTAAHERIPFLAIVNNNHTYGNDEDHQERVAISRDRDVSRKWIGLSIDDPAPDLALLARAQGLEGIGPITDMRDLPDALRRGLALVKKGKPVVVDVIVHPSSKEN
ncbi:thiamine pyrophosphate-binding protein [Microbacterium sp. SYP-A9085]|uniref:thiamine pyrophosphate-binding protein n=1 Tax=Microbacterium sp. SYP-A9085 TaxID=2664454 RepID=UPI00129AEC6B|nr:thiamine pyrophosphate-dependent enzyme [Microbacterium sp. SYP-A9085]MRH28005.1 thiamine pyrophosphate-binding protein [Microbacterium sp. SYP-A9085]